MKNILTTCVSRMLGTSLKEIYPEAIYVSSSQYDLRSEEECNAMFKKYCPECVIHLAARVGGVKNNQEHLGEFFYDNIKMNTNVLEYSRRYNVKKVVSLMSSCIFPDIIEHPLTEDKIHLGEPHISNFGYAYAKRALDIQSRAYRKQYGCNFVTIVPNNLVGVNDNYDLNGSHVVPALIRKIYEAKKNNTKATIWGDGSAWREFTSSKDIAKIIKLILEKYDYEYPLNVGNTQSHSIRQVVNMICDILGFRKENIIWDVSQPTGQYLKPSCNKKFLGLTGWKKTDYTPLKEVLEEVCEHFESNYPNLRGINGKNDGFIGK